MTGHSHQAWPDVGFEAQQQAWLDAAAFVDDKWEPAAAMAERVRAGWRRLLNEPRAQIALGQNTHELVARLLSALPLRERPRLVTSDGEFHTVRRQLDRLAEEGLDVVRVPARPAADVTVRIAAAIDSRTACAVVSSVYFETAEIVPCLEEVARACDRHGAAFLVDAYHHLNVVPFDVSALGLERAFITGGGYKYCQLGEGNCFLRIPPGCTLRPVLTGWFAEFDALARSREDRSVSYGAGAARFAGATYDPASHYRAAAVFAFHERMGLTPALLREVSRHQIGVLTDAIQALGVSPSIAHIEPMPGERRAGFLAIRSARAGALCRALGERGVLADFRSDVLRLGPAPYLCDDQLREVAARLGDAIRAVAAPRT